VYIVRLQGFNTMSQANGRHNPPVAAGSQHESDDESTTLLNGSVGETNTGYGTVDAGASSTAERPDDYMNRTQILILSFCRMVDPIAFFCIVPFINQMIFDLNQFPEADIGYYSGLIVSFYKVFITDEIRNHSSR
jgi:hypothetical protein